MRPLRGARCDSRRVARPDGRRVARRLLGAAGAAACITLAAPALAQATGVTVKDVNKGATATGIAEALVGGGVSVSNVVLTGSPRAAGTFTTGAGSIGFEEGIVMSSGKVQTYPEDAPCSQGVEGPNTCYEATGANPQGPSGWTNATNLEQPGDEALTTLAGFPTFDATILEFDFVPQHSTAQFSYVFSSDEYSDYSNTPFNDVFAFYVNGNNCALVPGTQEPVSVDRINNGNDQEGGDTTPHHPELFRDNVRPSPSIQSQMDGLTTMLTCNATVNAGQTNHMRLAIADASDPIYDSAVFIGANSLVSGTQVSTTLTGGGHSGASITVAPATTVRDHATLSGTEAASATGSVEYKVYSDSKCQSLVASAGTVPISGGTAPPSAPQTLGAGIYYWQASYSGDAHHNASVSECGSEVLTVSTEAEKEEEGEADPTTIVTSLTGGGQAGAAINVSEGTPVFDQATLRGTNVPEATGTVTYAAYSDNTCSLPVGEAGTVTISAGVAGPSAAITLHHPGTYYWQASYSGDAGNLPSKSACGTEVEKVEAGEPGSGAPEFGRCVKVAKGAGRFSSATCTTAGTTNSYQWVPGVAKGGFAVAWKTGLVTLETSSKAKVICTGASGAGEYAGTKAVAAVTLTLSGCEMSKVKCRSAAAGEGTIASEVLAGVLGVIALGETPAKNKIGLDLYAAGAGPVMSFTCGSSPVSVRGSVIAPVVANKMLLTRALVFSAALKGKQKPESFLGQPLDVLETLISGGTYQQTGLKASLTLNGEEAVEVNSVA